MKNLFDLNGKVALVTGGRRGIGKELALTLRQAGADVAVTARSEDRGNLPSDIYYFQTDLACRNARKSVIQKVLNQYSKIDILVNNAAIIDYQPVLTYEPKLWDEVISTNLSAVFELSVQAAPHMKTGKIIQLASVASFSGARNIAGYSTSKHGLIGMIKCLSNELMPMGINVNGIAPGVMKTDMHQSILDDEIRRREVEGRIPAARMGEASDLNGALIFLASDASNYVSGTTILVDGGYHGR